MALAWAQAQGAQKASPAVDALLANGGSCAADSTKGSGDGGGGTPAGVPPAGYVIIFTQVLPDGLGDLIFGENAIRELEEVASVVWVRCYTSEESTSAGERLIADTAATVSQNFVCAGRESLCASIGDARFEELWTKARERFLAPWIFGLSAHEETILGLARSTGRPFWALTEYGRGMGHIHTYTAGLGSMIPTGWTVDHKNAPGAVFRSIRRLARTGTDWRRVIAERCGVTDLGAAVRLWWFYSRKDDEKKHDFRSLGWEGAEPDGGGDGAAAVRTRAVSKVIPVTAEGGIALGHEKTSGEKLAEQLFEAAADPSFKPNIDVTRAEVAAGSAGQLSQFLWGILFGDAVSAAGSKEGGSGREAAVDIIVAPNVLTQLREESGGAWATARITQLDLVAPDGSTREVLFRDGRRVFVVSTRVPRAEMRTFLEQCEERVFTTGDQSLAEAMFMGKIPCVRPDAKVQQWELALVAKATGTVESVPDLGQVLRGLVTDEAARGASRERSRLHSKKVEEAIRAQLGGSPSTWAPTQQVLARAGMLG